MTIGAAAAAAAARQGAAFPRPKRETDQWEAGEKPLVACGGGPGGDGDWTQEEEAAKRGKTRKGGTRVKQAENEEQSKAGRNTKKCFNFFPALSSCRFSTEIVATAVFPPPPTRFCGHRRAAVTGLLQGWDSSLLKISAFVLGGFEKRGKGGKRATAVRPSASARLLILPDAPSDGRTDGRTDDRRRTA